MISYDRSKMSPGSLTLKSRQWGHVCNLTTMRDKHIHALYGKHIIDMYRNTHA